MTPIARTALAALLLAAPAALAAPALAEQTISVAPFRAIEVHGGGHVVLSHGDVQRVTLIRGDAKIADIHVDGDGTLMLAPCSGMCWGNHPLEVEVVTPAIAGLSVHGGGEIDAHSGFGAQPKLALEAHGGGEIDARAIAATDVSAEVHGGGEVELTAEKTLNADVHGGGAVRYWGHPSVNSEIHGGGSVKGGE